MRELLSIIVLIKKYNKLFLLTTSVALTAIAGAFEILSISAIYYLVKSLLDDKNKLEFIKIINDNTNLNIATENGIILLIVLVIILTVIKAIFLLLATYYQQKIVFNTATNVSSEIFLKYTSQSFDYFDGKGPSYFIRNLIGEINQLIDNGLLPTVTLLSESLIAGLLVITLIYINPIAAFLFLTILMVYWLLNSKIIGNLLSKWGHARQEIEHERIEGIQATFGAIKETVLYSLQEMHKDEFKTKTKSVFDLLKKHVYIQQIPKILLELIAFLIIIYVAVSVEESQGLNVIAFLTIFTGILLKLVPSMHRITNSLNSLKYSKEAIDIVKNGLSLKESSPYLNSKHKLSFGDKVEIKIAQAEVEIGMRKIIKNYTEEFKPGEIVAIVGKSGVGKSTLLDLIAGLRKSNVGRVNYLVNNVVKDVHEISFGYVTQFPYIFKNTIKFNITLNAKEIDHHRLNRVIQMTNLSDIIDSLPKGINQVIGGGGINLSGGQIQRIAIARAMYRSPALLILDEPTSALDRESSMEIMRQLQKIKASTTIILVTHSAEVAAFADRKIELGGI